MLHNPNTLPLPLTLLLAFFPLLAATGAGAKNWDCRNGDLEISCDSSRCQAQPEGGFTPMSVTLDARQGKMSVCAYTGCWEGLAKIDRRGTFIVFTGSRLKWSGDNPGDTSFAVVLDQTDNVAILKGGGFAHPLVCK